MNPNTTNADWIPGEDDDFIRAAIGRVRRDYAMQDERDSMGTGVYREWYLGGGELTERELAGIERRLHRRAQTLAEYHADPAIPEPRRAFVPGTPLAPRTCANPECGITFLPRVAAAKYHDAVCQKRAARKRSEAKRKASA